MKKNLLACPSCGAFLKLQKGFDHNDGTWICKKCGQLLYGRHLYHGSRFPGVLWYCDACHALLNQQPGFHDQYSVWKCRICGHVSPICQSEIYDSHQAYRDAASSK